MNLMYIQQDYIGVQHKKIYLLLIHIFLYLSLSLSLFLFP